MAEVCRAPRERSFPLRLTVRFADANNVRRVDGLARFFGVPGGIATTVAPLVGDAMAQWIGAPSHS